ncbi:hypothetical protein [Flavobacterium litorale]|uniref:Arm DNA-binding domain-containing protein n=1 Tax=Flavobacterium litorale TaxID=2856519 RepID=A0ABX8V7J9_9FLAO|nr:hypothetical protein [Flavobacterium litorale]QYJ68824.1 hypothetical protein K1I41_02790 [Flavobacterium litorale]
MATTIVLSLDKRRKRKTIAIPLHYFLEEKYWDEKNWKTLLMGVYTIPVRKHIALTLLKYRMLFMRY